VKLELGNEQLLDREGTLSRSRSLLPCAHVTAVHCIACLERAGRERERRERGRRVRKERERERREREPRERREGGREAGKAEIDARAIPSPCDRHFKEVERHRPTGTREHSSHLRLMIYHLASHTNFPASRIKLD
jgi:hypothetical protein